ncbi:MAG: hypothetical protein ACOC56_02365 [Atribacterota bacterium]
MQDRKIFLEDYSKLDELHRELAKKINDSNISIYVALGILESLKQEIILNNQESD